MDLTTKKSDNDYNLAIFQLLKEVLVKKTMHFAASLMKGDL